MAEAAAEIPTALKSTLLNYLPPFALCAFYPIVREQRRRRGEAPGSLRGDLVAVVAPLAVAALAHLALDAAGAAPLAVDLVPFVLGVVVFSVLERAAR